MRIVCDTDVLIRTAISPNGQAAELLRHIRTTHMLLASLPLLVEVLKVLRRPNIQALHGLDEKGIRRFVSALYRVATIVVVPQSVPRVVPHDPKDDAIVLTAIGGKANVLAARDHHFFHPDVLALAARHGVRIVRDDELLKELQASRPH